jgi:hypothetical protein
MELHYDKRISVYNSGGKIQVNTFDKIKNILDRINQKVYTEVVIGTDNEYLSIGGGNENYIVFCAINEKYYNLLNKNCINIFEEINLVAGGQEGSFSQRQIVNYDLMIQACEYYFINNGMDKNLIWEEE